MLDYLIRNQVNLRPYQLVFNMHSFWMCIEDKNERKSGFPLLNAYIVITTVNQFLIY